MARPISFAAPTVIELTPLEVVKCAAKAASSHVGLLPHLPRDISAGFETPTRTAESAA